MSAARLGVSEASLYVWKKKYGHLETGELRHILQVEEAIADPSDADSQRHDAFNSVTTFMTRESTSVSTHRRSLVLRDFAQPLRLSVKLDAATTKLEPDGVKRRARGEYSATLRESAERATEIILP